MKLGLYGGTFDPIHIAHLILAERVRESLNLDKLLFIPCAVPPHKGGRAVSPAHHRLAMLQMAIHDNKFFDASDIEIERGGVSYTVDTLEELSQKYSLERDDLFLIVGADNLLEIDTWKNPRRIISLSQLVAVGRPDFRIDKGKVPFDFIKIDAPLLQISSSNIRQMVREGKSIKYLVTPQVEQYIFRHHLYKNQN